MVDWIVINTITRMIINVNFDFDSLFYLINSLIIWLDVSCLDFYFPLWKHCFPQWYFCFSLLTYMIFLPFDICFAVKCFIQLIFSLLILCLMLCPLLFTHHNHVDISNLIVIHTQNCNSHKNYIRITIKFNEWINEWSEWIV